MKNSRFVNRYPYFSVSYKQSMKLYTYMYQGGGEPLVVLKDYMPTTQMMELYKDSQHTHDFYELTYVRNGVGTHVLNHTPYTIEQGDAFFLRPGDIHTYFPDSASKAFCVINCLFPYLPSDFSALRTYSAGKIDLKNDAAEEFAQLFMKMDAEFDERESGYRDMIQSYFRIALITMLRSREDTAVPSARRLLSVKEYIDTHFDSLDLQSCAAYAAYSPSHFCRLFRDCFGVTLTQYVNQKKVSAAKALLADTDLPIEEIMLRVGYHNKSHFYRVFQTYTNRTPAAYRAELLCLADKKAEK